MNSGVYSIQRNGMETCPQEYLDSCKHNGAAQKGSATLAGQNL